jgi:Flp pilus assembly protein CpaB
MKKNSIFLLAGALVFAIGVALLARALLAPPKAPAVASVESVRAEPARPPKAVLVAARDLQPGEFIDGSHLDWREVDDNPSRTLFFIRGQDDQESLYGATVRQPVDAGQALSASLVVLPGEPGFLAAVLKPGMRAVSIPTSRVESNFGLVSSGDRVDVILGLRREDSYSTVSQASSLPHLAAQTILHDVRVLALNDRARGEVLVRQEDGAKAKDGSRRASFETVTLEVTPFDAEKLAVAKEIGSMQLALRSAREPSDPEELFSGGVTTLRATTDLYGGLGGGSSAKVQAFRGNSSETISLAGQ